ncbi:MAG: HD domain-containing protein [Bacteroidota bacterium]
MFNYAHSLRQYPPLMILEELLKSTAPPTYVVGGFVRDLLLDRPSKDIDIVCVGDSIALAKAFAKKTNSRKLAIYKRFGTAMVHYQGWDVEFVNARKESYQPNSRKPTVTQGTLEDDQKRRDFTINALAIQLNPSHFGQLIDPFQGIQDLQDRLLRTPLDPAKTFSDDPLRMMRAIRFACQLSFTLHPTLHTALEKESNRLTIVSKERIITELNKIILSNEPARGFYLLNETYLLGHILPELQALQGIETIQGKLHKDNFIHTLQVLTNVSQMSDNLWLRWAALLHDIAKAATKRFHPKIGFTFHGHEELGARMVPQLFRRLKLPLNHHMRYVQKLVRLHLRPIAIAQDTVTDTAVRRLMHDAGEHINDLMTLCRADITSKNSQRVRKYLHNFEKVENKIAAVEQKDFIRNLQPIINGEQIMKIFDLPPCQQVGILKKALKEAVLDGSVPNEKKALYTYLIQIAKKHNLSPVDNHPNKT